MKNNKTLIIIFVLALFLRLYKLETIPVGFHADEVRAGWNAFSILKTGHDDHGNLLPLYYNTFGDFRPTGIIYLLIPSLAIFGRNIFAVRFLPALIGALTIFPVYFLSLEVSKKKKIANWSMFFLAISPWHISVSRATSEVCVSMFFALWGIYFLFREKPLQASLVKMKSKYLVGTIFIFISYLFYHSIRLLAPIFVLAIFALKPKDKKLFIIFLIISLITGLFTLQNKSRARFNQVSIFSDLDVAKELSRMPFEEGQNNVLVARIFHNKLLTYGRWFVNEYSTYFSSNFLITDIGKPGRYSTPGVGVLMYTELILFIFGLISIAQKKFSLFPFLLLLMAPIPAALTTEDAPNLHRAFYMVPFIIMIEAYGVNYLLNIKKYKHYIEKIILLSIFLNLIFYLHMYFVHSKYKIASSRDFGNTEVALEVLKKQNLYDKIILTNIPDDFYPWIAFYGNFSVKKFNDSAVLRDKGVWEYQNFVFSSQRCPSRDAFDYGEDKLLVVDAEGCATESKLNERNDVNKEEIKRPDESVVYTIWEKRN